MSELEDATKAIGTIIRHRDKVRLNIERLIHELRERAIRHDESKFSADELPGYIRINAAARNHPYGSKEYRESLASEHGPEGCITLHFERNSHHPEFHSSDPEMGWLDVIEMVLDWKAAADTYGQNSLRGSLPIHRERFNFTESQWWLINQVVDWIDPAVKTTAPARIVDFECEAVHD